MQPESLEMHALEMETAFIFGPSAYEAALDRIRNGSVSPEDVHIILTHPSPASGLADE